MKTQTVLIAFVLLVLGCKNPSGNSSSENNAVTYETYCNDRYDYCVDYPDFLIPQGEAPSGDGQKFISENGEQTMLAYREFKRDFETGDLLSIDDAFKDDIEGKNLKTKKLYDNYYHLIGKTDDNKLFTQYTILANNDYYVIYFEYPESDAKLFEAISEQVSESFNVGGGDADDGSFSAVFVSQFLNDCYWNKNFNTLLKQNDAVLAKYIDPQMDIRRYYSPGAIALLYDREDDFGFDEYADFTYMPESAESFTLYLADENSALCDLDFDENRNAYYQPVEAVPEEIVNMENFESVPVKLPYPNAEIMVVYVADKFNSPRAFYFIKTPNGWKLGFVNDSFCSA